MRLLLNEVVQQAMSGMSKTKAGADQWGRVSRLMENSKNRPIKGRAVIKIKRIIGLSICSFSKGGDGGGYGYGVIHRVVIKELTRQLPE